MGDQRRQGIQFTSVSDENQEAMRQFVSEVDEIEG